jgi:hypothetical protein
MSRKYRHHGYQDNDWEWDRERKDNGRYNRNEGGGFLDDQPNRSPRDPRERTGPKPTERDQRDEVFRCHLCGQTISDPSAIGKDDKCSKCEAPLWCCRNCTFFDPQARWECRTEISERVKRKDTVNTCEHFKPRKVLDTTGRSKADDGIFGRGGDEVGRKAFEALFGDD